MYLLPFRDTLIGIYMYIWHGINEFVSFFQSITVKMPMKWSHESPGLLLAYSFQSWNYSGILKADVHFLYTPTSALFRMTLVIKNRWTRDDIIVIFCIQNSIKNIRIVQKKILCAFLSNQSISKHNQFICFTDKFFTSCMRLLNIFGSWCVCIEV